MKIKETRAILDRIAQDGLGMEFPLADQELCRVRGVQLHRMLARAYCAGMAEGVRQGEGDLKAPGELLEALERSRRDDP